MFYVAGHGGPSENAALAEGGDFDLDFIAAHEDSYNHNDGTEKFAGSLQYADRDMGVFTREELEAEDFTCGAADLGNGDRIVFFTRVTVAPDASGTQTIRLTYHFDAENNGTLGVGYSEVVAFGISGPGDFPGSQSAPAESANSGDAAVALVNQTYLDKPQLADQGLTIPGDFSDPNAEILEVVLDVSGLEGAEQVIVRIDVRYSCKDGNPQPTGNLHAALFDAEVILPSAEAGR